MTTWTRRSLLATGLAALPLRARTLKIVGVQLYTLRNVLPQKPLETLQALERMGFREVEAIGDLIDKIWPSLQQTKLKPVSLHLDTALFARKQEQLPAALDNAKSKGFAYVICPYIAPQDRGGVDVIKRLGETLNKAGEQCRQRGLSLCYHNHAFEFEPSGGGTLLDVLMQTADRKLVSLELDIMWAQVAGVDPVSVLQRYKGRVPLLHLKNVAATEKRYIENVPRAAFREVGNGVIQMAPVLKAAQQTGVKHYFIEQDHTPGDPLDSLRTSLEYVSKLDY